MKTPVDPELRREARELRLRYGCEHCAHFDAESRGCAEGYPNAMHRDVSIDSATCLEFCKSFELC